jgi:hypothetical protein
MARWDKAALIILGASLIGLMTTLPSDIIKLKKALQPGDFLKQESVLPT